MRGYSDVSVTVNFNDYEYLKEMRVVSTRDLTAGKLTDVHCCAYRRIAPLQLTPYCWSR